MNNNIKLMIEEYQCSGCVCGSDTECFEKDQIGTSLSCSKHVVGTRVSGIGKIFLGLPAGFCRTGIFGEIPINIFDSFPVENWPYDKFNVPVWKYLDRLGNTIVRGLCPRVNAPFLHIFLGDRIKEIDCIEITNSDIAEMD